MHPGKAETAPAIHPTAIVDAAARIGPGAEIGPYCTIGAGVEVGSGARLISHVVVEGSTTIGARTVVYPFTMLGGPPQHLRYKNEDTGLVIGEDCLIREQVSIHRGTPFEDGETRLGNGVMVMAAVHVAHDCKIDDHAILASNSALGGHVHIGTHAFIGGMASVHQFCRIGEFAFVGGAAAVPLDVIPYGSALGNRARLGGLNLVGLKRAGMDRRALNTLRSGYHDLFIDEILPFQERVERVGEVYSGSAEVMKIVDFIRSAANRQVLPSR